MITKITENQEFSAELRNAVQQISEFEICFEVDSLSERISDVFNDFNVTETEIDNLERLLQVYCNLELRKILTKINNNIDFEESSGYDRRRIANGDYHRRSEASYNVTFLKLYKNIVDGIDEALKELEITFEGFTYHFSRHKKSLKAMLPKIRWADNKHEVRGKTAFFKNLEKECFEFFLVLLLFKTIKSENHD